MLHTTSAGLMGRPCGGGAWIETLPDILITNGWNVAPCAGAWIETSRGAREPRPARVARRKQARIETTRL
jgi:hypothetical protein